MLTFWIIAAALTGLALAFVLPPLLKKTAPAEVIDRDELNIVIYRERLNELKQDLDQGQLTPERFERAKEELEKNLLLDLRRDDAEAPGKAPGGRWAALAVLVLLPLLAVGGYWWSGDPQRSLAGGVLPGAPQTVADLEAMVAKLAARLEKEPDNLEGWNMLARSYRIMERHQEAAGVYAKLAEKTGHKDPEVLADYAEALGLAADGELSGKPTELLGQALELDPRQPKALWLSGMAAAQRKDDARAIQDWERLLAELEPGSEDAQMVEKQLGELRQRAAPAESAAPAPAQASTESAAGTAAESGPRFAVQVALSPEFQAQAQPGDTLFVYARAAEGPRMPLAIVKKQVKDLPLSVTLDDSQSMMPALKLSSVPQVVIAARISRSGQAMPQAGDLLGESLPLAPKDTQAVQITIDRTVSGQP